MKGFRSTAIMAAIVAAVVGYTYFDYQKSKKDEEKKAEQEKILQFQPEDVVAVSVKKKNESISLQKSEANWALSEPLADEGDNEAVKTFLESMAQEKGRELAKPEGQPAINWSEFFLDDPGATIELSLANKSKVAFQVSRLAAFDGSYYVRRGDQLFLGTSAWSKISEKSSGQLRNKKIYRVTGAIASITIESNDPNRNEKLTLTKAGDQWKLEGATKTYVLDQGKVQSLMDELVGLKALDYIFGPKDAAALKKYNLSKPAVKLSLKFAKQDKPVADWSLEIGAPYEGSPYGVSSAISSVFKLVSANADKFKVGRADLRDGKAPFVFPLEQAHEISVKTANSELMFKKDGSDWKLSPEDPAKVVEASGLQRLIEQLGKLEAKEFLAPAKGKGLSPAKNRILIRSADGKTLLEFAWGDEYKPDQGRLKGASLVYAKSSALAGEIMGVSTDDVKAMPLAELVKEKVTPAPNLAAPASTGQAPSKGDGK